MAKIDMNAVTQHMRGKLGDVVFRRRGERVYATLRPRVGIQTITPAVAQTRLRFRQAVNYANAATRNPSAAAFYAEQAEKRGKNAFALAVGDFFNPPVVDEIDVRGYHRVAGGKISVLARDDSGVVSVMVTITDLTTAAVVESGAALLSDGYWVYTATTAASATHPLEITVTATDRPGNEGTLTQAYP